MWICNMHLYLTSVGLIITVIYIYIYIYIPCYYNINVLKLYNVSIALCTCLPMQLCVFKTYAYVFTRCKYRNINFLAFSYNS